MKSEQEKAQFTKALLALQKENEKSRANELQVIFQARRLAQVGID